MFILFQVKFFFFMVLVLLHYNEPAWQFKQGLCGSLKSSILGHKNWNILNCKRKFIYI